MEDFFLFFVPDVVVVKARVRRPPDLLTTMVKPILPKKKAVESGTEEVVADILGNVLLVMEPIRITERLNI